jgi:hypothetical protein
MFKKHWFTKPNGKMTTAGKALAGVAVLGVVAWVWGRFRGMGGASSVSGVGHLHQVGGVAPAAPAPTEAPPTDQGST